MTGAQFTIIIVTLIVGAVLLVWSVDTQKTPVNSHTIYIDRNEKTCGEPFHRLNDKTGCNERVTECKSSDGVIVFINSAC